MKTRSIRYFLKISRLQILASLSLRPQERVPSALLANRGCGSMAGEYPGLVGQGQQGRLDRLNDLLVVAAGQIGAADASGKQRISSYDHFERRKQEANGALRVPWSVQHLGR